MKRRERRQPASPSWTDASYLGFFGGLVWGFFVGVLAMPSLLDSA